MITVPTRDQLLEVLPKGGRFCELGVFKGQFAFQMLDICQPTELHLIDRWVGPGECADQNGDHLETVPDLAVVYADLWERVMAIPYSPILLHRGRTLDELARFPNGYFDFVYVDADHHEEAVYADLVLAHQKTRGVIGGHDYCDRYPGVIRAVTRFCAEQGMVITHLTDDGIPSFLLGRA